MNEKKVDAIKIMGILTELWMDQMQVTGTVTITKKNGENTDEHKSFIANVPC